MVGTSTTPTKNADSPNESMNVSIESTRISDRTASSAAASDQDDDRDAAGPRRARRARRSHHGHRASRRGS